MSQEPLMLRALRGATTAHANTASAMAEAVEELLDALINDNALEGSLVLSATFSVTADLNAMFPASLARRRPGWDGVALMDCQQMQVEGDLPRCIRVMVMAWMPAERLLHQPYLRQAARLRPDRSGHN
ncbi:MAG: chorismate mutase [Synechococcus sp. TMED155]|jgi:chorismate mutase|nr:MAG: chorismate mutase [Synechococcus sp. TMED155]|tara:strand:- start:3012 stop:3395 length:384 start_codon:yes stop_codon:yes gene_type:complete